MAAVDERTRVSMPVVVLASLLLGVAGGVAGAVTTAYTLKEQVVAQVRDERRRELTFYVSREELASTRERDRDRLDAKLDELRVEVRALSVSFRMGRGIGPHPLLRTETAMEFFGKLFGDPVEMVKRVITHTSAGLVKPVLV